MAGDRITRLLARVITAERLRFLLAGYALTHLLLFLALETTPGILDRLGRVRGRDLLYFYVVGRTALEGGGRMYDQDYFLTLQESYAPITERSPRYYSIYPPTAGLFFAPLATLPYPAAVIVWWVLTAVLFGLAGWWLLHAEPLPDPWRRLWWLGLAAFHPVLTTFWDGHLSAFWLVVVAGGFRLHSQGRGLSAGLVFSLLALKPQLAVGIGVWLVLRRDVRALAGFCLGLLGQFLAVLGTFGFAAWTSYLDQVRHLYPVLNQVFRFDPSYEQSIAGIVTIHFGPPGKQYGLALQGLAVGWAGWQLWRTVRLRRTAPGPLQPTSRRLECAATGLFGLLASPHLLVYDLTLLLVPIAYLASCEADEWLAGRVSAGPLLYAAAAIAPVYAWTGFSLVPAALLWALYQVGAAAADLRKEAVPPTALQPAG